jgi:hypothetical protein
MFTCAIVLAQSNVGIGTTTPHASAVLELKSTNKGVLVPRVTTAQRNAIASPATGLLVFDSTTGGFWFYSGTTWKDLSTGAVLKDADGDTKIQVEESADEDIIRFDVGGTEHFRMQAGRLYVMNTGSSVFLGESAGFRDDLTNNNNVYIGYTAGFQGIIAESNVAVGYEALQSNTANHSTAIGYHALTENVNGLANTATGSRALSTNLSGSHNTASGFLSMLSNTAGDQNSAFGGLSLYANTTGTKNCAVGYQAYNEYDRQPEYQYGSRITIAQHNRRQ